MEITGIETDCICPQPVSIFYPNSKFDFRTHYICASAIIFFITFTASLAKPCLVTACKGTVLRSDNSLPVHCQRRQRNKILQLIDIRRIPAEEHVIAVRLALCHILGPFMSIALRINQSLIRQRMQPFDPLLETFHGSGKTATGRKFLLHHHICILWQGL